MVAICGQRGFAVRLRSKPNNNYRPLALSHLLRKKIFLTCVQGRTQRDLWVGPQCTSSSSFMPRRRAQLCILVAAGHPVQSLLFTESAMKILSAIRFGARNTETRAPAAAWWRQAWLLILADIKPSARNPGAKWPAPGCRRLPPAWEATASRPAARRCHPNWLRRCDFCSGRPATGATSLHLR